MAAWPRESWCRLSSGQGKVPGWVDGCGLVLACGCLVGSQMGRQHLRPADGWGWFLMQLAGFLMRGPEILGAGISPLVGGTKAQCILGLVQALWWTEPRTRLSGCGVQWFWSCYQSPALPMGSRAIAGPLMCRAVSQDLCLKVSGGPIAAVSQLSGRAGS